MVIEHLSKTLRFQAFLLAVKITLLQLSLSAERLKCFLITDVSFVGRGAKSHACRHCHLEDHHPLPPTARQLDRRSTSCSWTIGQVTARTFGSQTSLLFLWQASSSDENEAENDCSHGIQTFTSGTSVQDYFKQKLSALKAKNIRVSFFPCCKLAHGDKRLVTECWSKNFEANRDKFSTVYKYR